MIDFRDPDVAAAMYTLLVAKEKKNLFDKGNLNYEEYQQLAYANVDLEIARMARAIREETGRHAAAIAAVKKEAA